MRQGWYNGSMDSTPAAGLSLWLMPEGEVQRELAGWIDRLAERFRTERFAPHLTLLGSIPAGRGAGA